MKHGVESAAQIAAQNPKVAAIVAAGTTSVGLEGWLLNSLPEYLSIIASLLGIVLALFLIRNHYLAGKKLKMETKILEDQALENKTKCIDDRKTKR